MSSLVSSLILYVIFQIFYNKNKLLINYYNKFFNYFFLFVSLIVFGSFVNLAKISIDAGKELKKYESGFKENLSNWDVEHETLSNSNKSGKVMNSLSKNKEITDRAKLASGKISETLTKIDDKKVKEIIEMLDEKYLPTKSEKYVVLS